jgi:hypothetical protein
VHRKEVSPPKTFFSGALRIFFEEENFFKVVFLGVFFNVPSDLKSIKNNGYFDTHIGIFRERTKISLSKGLFVFLDMKIRNPQQQG